MTAGELHGVLRRDDDYTVAGKPASDLLRCFSAAYIA
jgi:hypothetical protein